MAQDGAQALEFARRCQPDVVLMDVRMARLDGLQATRRLRQDPATRSMPVIAPSASLMPGGTAAGPRGRLHRPHQQTDRHRDVSGRTRLQVGSDPGPQGRSRIPPKAERVVVESWGPQAPGSGGFDPTKEPVNAVTDLLQLSERKDLTKRTLQSLSLRRVMPSTRAAGSLP